MGSRERILEAALQLLAEGGRAAVSTRAVSAAAKVQPPTIYRQFGDMDGLLDAVVSEGFATYLQSKTGRESVADPVDDLREGWNLHVEFGLANPALYALMYGTPRQEATPSPAAASAADILHTLVENVAKAGRLTVGVELAARVISAAGVGVVLESLARKPEDRDETVSTMTREAVLNALTTDDSELEPLTDAEQRTQRYAVALKAALSDDDSVLTASEQGMLSEWLDRLADERQARSTAS